MVSWFVDRSLLLSSPHRPPSLRLSTILSSRAVVLLPSGTRESGLEGNEEGSLLRRTRVYIYITRSTTKIRDRSTREVTTDFPEWSPNWRLFMHDADARREDSPFSQSREKRLGYIRLFFFFLSGSRSVKCATLGQGESSLFTLGIVEPSKKNDRQTRLLCSDGLWNEPLKTTSRWLSYRRLLSTSTRRSRRIEPLFARPVDITRKARERESANRK